MATLRIQAGDFQDAGVNGNLSKIAAVKEHANALVSKGSKVSLDLVGDLFDAHILADQNQSQALLQLAQVTEPGQKALKEYLDYFQQMMSKYGQSFYEKAKKEEKAKLEQLNGAMMGYGIIGYYAMINNTLSECKSKVFSVHGNNDTLDASKVITKAKFIDLEHKVMEDNGVRILGGNNTNYDQERAFDQSVTVKNDGDYDWDKVKDPFQVLMLHGPPNGAGLRDGHDSPANKLDAMIKAKKPQLVECGHFHSGLLKTVGGVTYARSSPKVYFVHKFEGDKYKGTDIFSYAA
jgi:Icc-related predicted phosphoesterase